MNYFDLADIVNGDYSKAEETSKPVLAKEHDLILFKKLLKIDNTYSLAFGKTDSANEFYESFELFNQAFDDSIKQDVFYCAKNGYILEGIPGRLVYLLKLAIKSSETPSLAIQSVSALAWGNSLKKGYIEGDLTIKDVLDSLYGYDVRLLTKLQPKVKYEGFSEVYVSNVDRICLLPNSIADQFNTLEDLGNIKYISGKGVCFNDEPLRTFGSLKGITFDEFDLRDVK